MRAGLVMTLAAVAATAGNLRADDIPGITKSELKQKMPNGAKFEQYTLKRFGITMKVIPLGGIITNLMVPDKDGNPGDIVLGFDEENLEKYLKESPYFGAITGRYCNRIAKGKFTLEGKEYSLATNNGPNHLHGGKIGFDKVVWKVKEIKGDDFVGLELTRRSPDGEEGYPGNLDVTVRYKLTDGKDLRIEYEAVTDKPTPVNLTNHTYFNLAGPKNGDILHHDIWINAESYTPVDDTMITTGKIEPVKGTPYDFTSFKVIGKDIGQIKGEPGGYDVNYVLHRQPEDGLTLAATLREPKSGRIINVFTTEPGLQFYTGNFLDGTIAGKERIVYKKHYGVCLETGHFPDSPNKPNFPSTILRPGEKYMSTTIYRFGVLKDAN
jgi:aldose 1-epimerase